MTRKTILTVSALMAVAVTAKAGFMVEGVVAF
jgi:hypothetical protein